MIETGFFVGASRLTGEPCQYESNRRTVGRCCVTESPNVGGDYETKHLQIKRNHEHLPHGSSSVSSGECPG